MLKVFNLLLMGTPSCSELLKGSVPLTLNYAVFLPVYPHSTAF